MGIGTHASSACAHDRPRRRALVDGERFIPCRRGFFLPVRVLSRLFRRLFLGRLAAAHEQGRLILKGELAQLAPAAAFGAVLKPLRRKNWFVYAKRPFAGPKVVLAYLSRYTHRVAISNARLIARDGRCVTFHYKDYRAAARVAQFCAARRGRKPANRRSLAVVP
jgi:Putative transposase